MGWRMIVDVCLSRDLFGIRDPRKLGCSKANCIKPASKKTQCGVGGKCWVHKVILFK